jgi:aerobic carbon-monoxide dehydrogenase small subunit
MSQEVTITLVVNGRPITKVAGAHFTLLRWLRDAARVTDPKYGCGEGICGACTVLVDGEPAASCILLAAQVDGAQITTAAGLLEQDGSLGPLQRAFHEYHAAQCGFCTPGMLLTARWLLDRNPDPTAEQVREAISGQVCRCTGYENIVRSIRWAAKHSQPEDAEEEEP